MSVPDADTLIRLAEILEVYVSELLGTKIENENVASDVAEQLSRINEQLAMSAAMTRTRPADRTLRFIILLLARWTCPNNRPTYPTQCASAG